MHQEMAGVYSWLPLGLRVLRKVENIIREEMNALGAQEILMTALQPKENWILTKRWETVDVLFKVPSQTKKEYALGPSHEEEVTPLVQHFVKSYKDLPLAVYQIQCKFRDELRAKSGVFSLSQQLQFLRADWKRSDMGPLTAPEDPIPPGRVESTPLGSHYLVQATHPHDHFHGKVRLSRFSPADLQFLITLMREKASVPDREGIVFLDTETTGIQGGAGMCPFLVGLGYFAGDEFHLLQYFIRDFDEEPSMLSALGELLSRFRLVVTYNGAAFDIPLLETRFALARLESPFPALSHFDLLFTARKLWRNGHGSCRLAALEHELISFLRGPDVPGSMIPRLYFDYLHQNPAPALRQVFTHNIHDVVSLAALTIHACDRVTLAPAPLDAPLDLYSLGRVFENSAEWRRSRGLYEMALAGGLPDGFRKKALENLTVVCRRAGEHEQSLETAEALMAGADFSMPGYESAAIYFERITGDLDRALRIVDEGLSRADNKRWRMLLKARWDRLQARKISTQQLALSTQH